MPWKCPNDGTEYDVPQQQCRVCGTTFVPACVVLTSVTTGRELRCKGDTNVGRTLLHIRLEDPDALYSAERQFSLIKDEKRGRWRLHHEPGVQNPTWYDGDPVPADGAELHEGGVITLGKNRLALRVGFES